MTKPRARLGKLWEWLWRSGNLRELRSRRPTVTDVQALEGIKAWQTLAWRALSGLEPIPSATRSAAAQPLISTGIKTCLRLMGVQRAEVDELFTSDRAQEALAAAGLEASTYPAVREWLTGHPGSTETGQLALRALDALVEHLEGPTRRVYGVLWRRVAVVALLVGGLSAITAATIALLTPPEGADLAAGKPWKASSSYPGFPPSGAKPIKPPEGAFFSTNNEEESPWWVVDLQNVKAIGSATIENRSDCCLERAHPLVLELSVDGQAWKEVARQTDVFRTWRPKFRPANAQFVRLRALKRTHLHLKDVRVHSPPAAK